MGMKDVLDDVRTELPTAHPPSGYVTIHIRIYIPIPERQNSVAGMVFKNIYISKCTLFKKTRKLTC